jgi:hypothetical protein
MWYSNVICELLYLLWKNLLKFGIVLQCWMDQKMFIRISQENFFSMLHQFSVLDLLVQIFPFPGISMESEWPTSKSFIVVLHQKQQVGHKFK